MAKRNNNSLGRRAYGGKPYDANNSFVKKMATKVTDLIPQRSWISKWFNASQDNGEANEDDLINGEEEAQQPPVKRPRIRMAVTYPPGTFSIKARDKDKANNHESQITNETEEYFSEPAVAGPSGVCKFVSSTPAVPTDARNSESRRTGRMSHERTGNNVTTNGADDNSESGESTSGCSSLIPQTSRQEGAPNSAWGSNMPSGRNRFMDDKFSFANHLQSPRSLFLEGGGSRESLSASRRPSFNASMMNNNGNNFERVSSLSSPFYSGNVTFGGANAIGNFKRSRSLFNSTNEYQLKIPRRTSVQVKPSNVESIDSSGMSQTAKRILEAMEYFSSPISDAKKIPVKSITETTVAKKRLRDERSASNLSSTRVGLRHLTRELAVPTVPEMLKLQRRRKLQDTTLAARKIISAMSGSAPATSSWSATTTTTIVTTVPAITASAKQSATIPEEYHLRTDLEKSPKYHGKLRAKSKNNPEEEGPAPSVNLPSIALPITSLPSFEPLPKYTAPLISSTRRESTMEKTDDRWDYKFASPIKITEASWNLKSINNFSFSKPLNASETTESRNDCNSVSTFFENNSKAEKSNSCADGVAMNFMWSGSSTAPRLKAKPKHKDTEEIGQSTIFDSSAIKEMGQLKSDGTTNVNFGTLRSPTSDRTLRIEIWECSECYIKNDASENTCVACKTPKRRATGSNEISKFSSPMTSEATTASRKISTGDTGFVSQFKMNVNQWECGSCLVRNTMTSLKCVSCSSPKPGSAKRPVDSLTNSSKTPVKNELAEKFKPAEGSWECPGCMLRNLSSVITCPCCSAPKPMTVKGSPKQSSSGEAATGEPSKNLAAKATDKEAARLMDKFKPAASSWECSSCMVRNNETSTSCVCCSNPKPGAPTASRTESTPRGNIESGWGDKFKKPEGSWSCDSCMVQNKSEANECVACSAMKPGATQKPQAAAPQFSFGVPSNGQGFKFGTDKPEVQPKWASSSGGTNGFTFGAKQTNVDSGNFTFGIAKKTEEGETPGKGSNTPSVGFVFATPKTAKDSSPKIETIKSNEVTRDSVKAGSDEKANAGTFLFGTPKTGTKKPEASPEVSTNLEGNSSTKANSPKAPFVFGVPKSQENPSSDNKIKFDLPTSEKPTIFGNQAQGTTSNDSNTLSTMKNTGGDQQGKPLAPSILSPSASPSTASEPKPKIASQAPNAPSFGQTFAPQATSTFSITGASVSRETNLASSKSPEKPVASNFGIHNSTNPSTGLSSLPNASGPSTPVSAAASEPKNFFASAEKPKSTFFDVSGEKATPAFGTTVGKNALNPLFANPDDKTASPFGSTEKSAPSNTMFNSGTPTSFSGIPAGNSRPVFGSNTAPVFGGGTATPAFSAGSNVGTSNIFASATKTNAPPAPANNPGIFSFGAANSQPTPSPSTASPFFSTTDSTETSKPMFRFGNTGAANPQPNPTDCFGAPAPTSGAFGAPAANVASPAPSPFTFNAPATKPEPPAFGQLSATIPNIFGTQPTPTGIGQGQTPATFSTNNAPSSTGFNFAANAAPSTNSGGFNFAGAMAQPAAAPTGSFNFNAPSASPAIAFDPNTRPSFNFTGGSAPSAFVATPQPVTGRKIKKAVRRMQQR